MFSSKRKHVLSPIVIIIIIIIAIISLVQRLILIISPLKVLYSSDTNCKLMLVYKLLPAVLLKCYILLLRFIAWHNRERVQVVPWLHQCGAKFVHGAAHCRGDGSTLHHQRNHVWALLWLQWLHLSAILATVLPLLAGLGTMLYGTVNTVRGRGQWA